MSAVAIADKATVGHHMDIQQLMTIYEFARKVHQEANSPRCKLLEDARSELMVVVNVHCRSVCSGRRAFNHMMNDMLGPNFDNALLVKIAVDPVRFYMERGSDCRRVCSIVVEQWDAWHRDLSLWHILCSGPTIMKDGVLIEHNVV